LTDFNDAQRKATRDAGKLAGLDILRIINEPTAAAIAYGLHEKGGDTRHLIYHLGGGTCAVSLLSIDDGVFEILATAGNTRLGGDNFDHRVAEYLRNAYEKKTGIDVTKNLRAMERLKREAKRAKHALSSQQSIQIKIESFENGNNFSEILTRAKFEELNDDLFLETIKYVGQVLQEADMKKHELDEVRSIIMTDRSHMLTTSSLLHPDPRCRWLNPHPQDSAAP
jgi:heat shock protein 5